MSRSRKWSGLKDLEQFLVPISALVPDPRNPRRHADADVDVLAEALKEDGQHRCLVVSGGCVRVGNGLLAAAKRLGWTHLAAVEADDTEAQARARSIADNRTGEVAEFRGEIVRSILEEAKAAGMDLNLLGYGEDEVAEILGAGEAAVAGAVAGGRTQCRCPKCGKKFTVAS